MLSPAVPRPPAPAAALPLWTELAAGAADAVPLAPDVMACLGFGPGPAASDDPRYIHVDLPLLGGAGRFELWRSARPVTWDCDGTIAFAHDREVLIGHVRLLACELDDIAAATFRAYAQIAAFLERQAYPWLLRCWNFLDGINSGDADRERYKQFCIGRYQALSTAPGFERQLPAGTAIGTRQPGLLISFLAAREPGIQVENPRQMPAFRYPRQYGPRSPSFSRATLRRSASTVHLLMSGTASVVGHTTRHPGETAAQLEETLANVRSLLGHAGAHPAAGGTGWSVESLKLYVRDRTDLELVRRRVAQALGPAAPVLYLEGDICRRDLQLEIEGVYAGAPAGNGA